MHNYIVVNIMFLEVLLELCEIPLTRNFTTSILDIVIVMLVHGVVGQVDVLLVHRFLTVGVLGCRKPHKTFFEDVNFKGVIASNEAVDAQIILKTIDQVGVRNVLRNYIARFLFYFLFLTNNLDTSTA
jgi:hypothetical protein